MTFAKLKRSPDAQVVLALLALATLLVAPMALARQAFYWADYALVFYPWHVFKQQCLRDGALPLWNPYVLGGMPFIGNLQSAVFYPINLLTTFAAPHKAFLYSAWIHVALAGLFQHGFLRSLRLSVLASFVGATCFMLGGFTICRLQYPTILAACVWTPLLCWLLVRLWQQPTLPRSALLAFAFAVQLLAGHLQMSAMSVLLLIGFAISGAGSDSRSPRQSRDRDAPPLPTTHHSLLTAHCSLLTALILGALIAALQILPALGTLRASTRSRVDYDFVSIYSLPPWQMTTFFLPFSFGHPSSNNYWGEGNYYEICGYFGVLPLLFALVGTFQRSNVPTFQRLRWYFVAMSTIGLLLAFGRYAPFHSLAHHVPGFGSFKGPGRFLFLVAFSSSGLAALGWESILSVKNTQTLLFRRLVGAWAALLSITLVILCFAQRQVLSGIASLLRLQFQRIGVKLAAGDFPSVAQQFYHTLSTDILRVLILLLVLIVALRFSRRQKWLTNACLFVLFADLLPFGWRTIPTTDARFYEYKPPLVERLRDGATPFRLLQRPNVIVRAWSSDYVSFNGFGNQSLPHLRGWLDLFAPNLNMCHNVFSVEGYEPLRPARWHELLIHAQDRLNAHPSDTKLLDLLNVKYVATLHRTELENAASWHRSADGRPRLYENKNALPRAWFVEQTQPVASWQQAKQAMDAATFDPRQTAIVEGQNVAASFTGVGRVAHYNLRNNQLSLRCEVKSASSFLVLSEAWSSGWRAALNRQSQPLWRANGVLRGMEISEGQQEVKMVYAPTEFRVGTFLSLLGIAVALAMLLTAKPFPRHARESARPKDAAASAQRPRSLPMELSRRA